MDESTSNSLKRSQSPENAFFAEKDTKITGQITSPHLYGPKKLTVIYSRVLACAP